MSKGEYEKGREGTRETGGKIPKYIIYLYKNLKSNFKMALSTKGAERYGMGRCFLCVGHRRPFLRSEVEVGADVEGLIL